MSLKATLVVPICLAVTKEMNDLWHNAPIEALASKDGKGKNLSMNMILQSLRQSFEALLRFRMFLLIFLLPVAAVIGLFLLFVIYWQEWSAGLTALFAGMSVFQWIESWSGLQELSLWFSMAFLILVFIPLVYLTSVLLISVLVMPLVVKWVGDSDFKHLEKKRGGSFLGSLWNTLVGTVVFVVVFIATLPLWLVPGFQIGLPLLLTSWLNKKVFLYDVLQDFATQEERVRIAKAQSLPLYGMGCLLGFLSYIPLAFFFVPVLSALSYTYFGLNALAALRKGES
ncbi:MAG: EI24 domain-containing protein [Bdellovibrio sp.]|nr:EI24 domain-containing protein [Bdellovibrio sp.]